MSAATAPAASGFRSEAPQGPVAASALLGHIHRVGRVTAGLVGVIPPRPVHRLTHDLRRSDSAAWAAIRGHE